MCNVRLLRVQHRCRNSPGNTCRCSQRNVLWWPDYPTQISNFYNWTRNGQKVKPALLETNFRALRFGIAKHYECKNKDGRDFHVELDEPTEIVRVLWDLMAQPHFGSNSIAACRHLPLHRRTCPACGTFLTSSGKNIRRSVWCHNGQGASSNHPAMRN